MKFINSLINFFICAVLICAILIGGYAAWDTYYNVYGNEEKQSSELKEYKPVSSQDNDSKENNADGDNIVYFGDSANKGTAANNSSGGNNTENNATLSNNQGGDNNNNLSGSSNSADSNKIINPGIEELKKKNSDVVGWITLDNTKVDYPFVQGASNATYVSKNIYKEFSVSGACFIDYRSNENISDFSTIFYAHHLDNGGMFTDLDKYSNKSFFENNKYGMVYTSTQTHKIEIVSYIYTTATDTYIYNPYYTTEDLKTGFIKYIKSAATNYRELNLKTSDKFVTLTTCSSDSTNARHVVVAKIIN